VPAVPEAWKRDHAYTGGVSIDDAEIGQLAIKHGQTDRQEDGKPDSQV
jgi:hypothetical protein